jgi:TolA-binding protein
LITDYYRKLSIFLFRLIIGISLVFVSATLAETSMFGAGNLNDSSPYGLTKTEEVIVKNKKIVIKNEKILKKTNTQVQDLNERVDGIESLLDGESLKLNKVFISLNKNIDNLKLHTQNTSSTIEQNSEKITTIEDLITLDMDKLQSQINQNNKNIKTIQKSFDKIVVLVNEINSKYVTKKEFNQLLALLDKQEVKSKAISIPVKKNTSVKKKSNKERLAEAKILFKKDNFTKAIIIFEDLISKNYRPAENNFYVGEIKYYRKKYKDALHYFKNSMTLYDKATYLPKLLLHSAISFEKLGDNDNAQNFYNTIVDIYPESNEAKEASKKIKN